MIEGLVIVFALGLVWLTALRKGRWKERARAAQRRNKTIRKAHALKNEISRDPALRRRVREHFDAP